MSRMSLTIKQINELRAYAKDRKGELAKLIADAADTIEVLSAKLLASQMERSSHYYHGGWIPADERLPEEAYPVIVTWKNDDPASYYQYILGKHYVGVAHYKNGKWLWYSSTTEDVLMEYGRCDFEEFDEAIKVVAWRRLPEPYWEEGE